VLNADDAFSFEFLRAIRVERQIAYSLDERSLDERSLDQRSLDERRGAPERCVARDARHTPGGLHFTAATPVGDIALASPLVGAFNISNILAAVGAAIAAGVSAPAIQAGVAAMRGVPGRMERIDLGQPFTAIVDFAHTPNALEQCLRTLRPLARGQLIVVFGCAGERDQLKRPLMGQAAARCADRVVLTAEDPRRESLEAILDQIEAGMAGARAPALRVPDREEAIRAACALAAPGDIVVSCGKGHEQSMCFGTTETPWDDRAAMRRAVSDWLKVQG
jgi:UDP-N-acetylmuramoyl-L-alanyl-D-glutamate--2,6-diaminopimelate ligase